MKSAVSTEVDVPRDNLFSGFLELAGLCGFAFAMPVLDVFGRSPEVFTEAKVSSADLWWFALLIAFVPPLLLAAIELVFAVVAGKRASRFVHLLIVGCLSSLVAVRMIRLGIGIEGTALLAIAVLVGILLGVGHTKYSFLRQWLRFGSFAPFLFAGVFLFSSPVHSLVQGAGKAAATAVAIADTSKERPPIVMFVLDEFPVSSLLDAEGNVDADRFPGFAALAEGSTWFRNTTSVAGHTVHAVPAIFTGRYATRNELHATARDHPDNIFRLLGNAYRFNVSELTTQLCAVPRCDPENLENAPTIKAPNSVPNETAPNPVTKKLDATPLATVFGKVAEEFGSMVALHDIDSPPSVDMEELVIAPPTTTTAAPRPVDETLITQTTVDRTAEQVASVQPSRFSDWLARVDADTTNPAFNMLHLTMPHNPYYIDSTGTAYQVPDDNRHVLGFYLGKWRPDPGSALSAKQRHLLQVRYVDTLITAMIERLKDNGLWDKAVVLVTADHGASFDPGGSFRQIDDQSQVNVIGVPLFVRGSDFEPGVIDDRPIQTVDIMPTLATVAGVDTPWSVDGIAITELGDRVRTRYVAEATDVFTYRIKTIDVSRHLEQLLARLPNPDEDGGGDLAIMRTGPSGELLRRNIDDLQIDDSVDVGSVDIDFPSDRDFSVTADGRVSALVLGTISTGGANQTVVLVVDGRVGATSLTFYDGEGHEARFVALIPPVWMKGDDHDVSFYLLNADGALAPLG